MSSQASSSRMPPYQPRIRNGLIHVSIKYFVYAPARPKHDALRSVVRHRRSCLSLFFTCSSSITPFQFPFVSQFRSEEIRVKRRAVLCTQTLLEMCNLVSLRLQVKGKFLQTRLVRNDRLCAPESSPLPRRAVLLPRLSSCPALSAALQRFSNQTLV